MTCVTVLNQLRGAGVFTGRRMDNAMKISNLHHLGLTVADADASAIWYSNVLGFLVFRDPDNIQLELIAEQ